MHGLLSARECADLQARALHAGMEEIAGSSRALRECGRVELDDDALASTIWERVRPHLPRQLVVCPRAEDSEAQPPQADGLPHGEEAARGTWEPCGINPHFRIVRYAGDGVGHFGPHRDAHVQISADVRSLMTINGYLSEVPIGAGGRTRFLSDELSLFKDERGRFTVERPEEDVLFAFRPSRPGCALVFNHQLLHDGEPLADGAPPKWLIRTDVLFRRQPDGRPPKSAAVLEAEALEVEAQAIECEDPMRATELYRRAERLRQGRIAAR
jgi:hypothetical protein